MTRYAIGSLVALALFGCSKKEASSSAPPFVPHEIVNVLDFGAVGDGVTDDTEAIQSAFDAYAGDVEFFFPGTSAYYRLTSNVTPPMRNVRIYGPYARLHQTTQNAVTIAIRDGSENIEISHLKLTGTGKYVPGAGVGGRSAIDIAQVGVTKGSRNIHLHHLIIENVSTSGISSAGVVGFWIHDNNIDLGDAGEHGIYVVCPLGEKSDTYIMRNRVVGPGAGIGAGITVRNANDLTIADNKIHGALSSITVNGATVDDPTRAVTIRHNSCTGGLPGSAGIAVAGGSNSYLIDIVGNRIFDMRSDAIISDGRHVRIQDNTVVGTVGDGRYAIRTVGHDPVVVGNVLYDNANGIRLQGAEAGTLVTGNRAVYLDGVAGVGIRADQGSEAFQLEGNVISGYHVPMDVPFAH